MRSLRAIEHEGTWRLPATPRAVSEMRANVRRLLEQHCVGPTASADIALAVSEAVANSVLHAYPDTVEPGPVEVRAQVLESSVVITVSDEGVGMHPRTDSPGLGIGLPLIGRLASSVDIRAAADNGGAGLRMTFKVPELAGPSPSRRERERATLLDEVGELAESVCWPHAGYYPLLDALVPRLADVCAIDLLGVTDDGLQRVAARVAGPGGEGIAAELERGPLHQAALERALASPEPRLVRVEPDSLDQVALDARAQQLLADMGVPYWARLPLFDGGRPLGVLVLGMRSSRPDPREEVEFLRELAAVIARGITRARLVAALRDTGERLEHLLSRLTTAVTLRDRGGNLVYANDAAVELLGATSLEEVLASGMPQLAMRFAFAHEDGTPLTIAELPASRLLRGEEGEPLVIRAVERVSGRERWVAQRARMVDGESGLVATISEDVTAAKAAEVRRRLLAGADELGALRDDPERALVALAELMTPALADWAWVHVRDRDGLRLVALSHPDPERRERARELVTLWPPRPNEPGGAGEVIRTGLPQLHPYLTEDLLRERARDAEHLRFMRMLVLRSELHVPVELPGGGTAALGLATAESWRRLDRRQLEFVRELAARAEAALADGAA